MHLLETYSTLKLKRKLTDSEIGEVCGKIRGKIAALSSKNPLASVVVPAFNEEMYILLMMQAMADIDTNHPIEFIGIDNGSTDRTAEILQQSGFNTVTEKRKGTSYARQAGLEAAKGEFIFTTDADTLVPPLWINYSLGYFKENRNLGLLSGGIDRKFLGALPIHDLLRFSTGILRKIRGKNKEVTRFFPGANSVFKRELALQVGGYELGSDRGEDNILALKIGKVAELLKVDDDPGIRVITSGRRLSTLPLLGKMLQERALDVLRIDENTRQNRTFTDVR